MGNCAICSEEDVKQNAFNPHLTTRSNLVFKTNNRDIEDHYEVLEILGEGSMGKVSCVRKKKDAIGGSAYHVKKKGWFGQRITVPNNHMLRKEASEHSMRKQYALKSIILSRVSDEFLEELRNEVAILQSLDHPNIVKAFEVYETKVNIYVVLQHCSGGDLYRRVPYSEKQSAKIVGKLLSAIAYMHAHNVTHRDIKFENIMFESRDPDAEIKLIDFGLSKVYSQEKQFMTAGVGTIYTMVSCLLLDLLVL